jgi:L-phenylalanine/L-methionine N-acetyltransferase
MSYTIRHATAADAEGVWRNMTDESAYNGTLQLPYSSPDRWRERLAPADGVVNLVACAGDEIVGNGNLHTNTKTPRRAHAGSLGMAVPAAWQRKGVGTALLGAIIELADHWLGLARLELTVYVDNEAALALYRKHDFEIEGTMRGYALRRGVLVDTHAMARLRDRPQITR